MVFGLKLPTRVCAGGRAGVASLLLTDLVCTGDSLDCFGIQVNPLRQPAIRGTCAFGAWFPCRWPQSGWECWLDIRLSHTTTAEVDNW